MIRFLRHMILLACVAFSAISSMAFANPLPPDQLVKQITQETYVYVNQDPLLQKGDTSKLIEWAEKSVVNSFDFQRMTRLAVGKDWRQATPEQQKRLQEEFKGLLVRTYSGALTQVKDQSVSAKPLRANPADAEVIVRSEIIGRGDPIQLDYRMEKTPSGWRIYDLNVLGVWLVETYRTQFAQEISARGIDGLIATLAERNKAAGAVSAKKG